MSADSPEAITPASKSVTDHSFDSVQPLQAPKILLGHGSNAIASLPSVVRYWDKVNVTPLHGTKDIHSIAVVSDAGGINQLALTEEWLHQVGKLYTVSASNVSSALLIKIKGTTTRCSHYRTISKLD